MEQQATSLKVVFSTADVMLLVNLQPGFSRRHLRRHDTGDSANPGLSDRAPQGAAAIRYGAAPRLPARPRWTGSARGLPGCSVSAFHPATKSARDFGLRRR